jgi:hypothetical protein
VKVVWARSSGHPSSEESIEQQPLGQTDQVHAVSFLQFITFRPRSPFLKKTSCKWRADMTR